MNTAGVTAAVIGGVAAVGITAAALLSTGDSTPTAVAVTTTITVAAPDAPGAAQASFPYQVDVQWNRVADADGYKVFRRVHGVGATYALIATLSNADIAATDPALFSDFPPDMVTYDYKVKAFNELGDSVQPTTLVVVPS